MSRSLLLSGMEFLITGRVQTEAEWPPVKGTDRLLSRWETVWVTSKVLPHPRFYERAPGVEHYCTNIYITIHQHSIPNTPPYGARGELLSTQRVYAGIKGEFNFAHALRVCISLSFSAECTDMGW